MSVKMKNSIGPVTKKVTRKTTAAKKIRPEREVERVSIDNLNRRTLVVCNIWGTFIRLEHQVEEMKEKIIELENRLVATEKECRHNVRNSNE